MTTTEQIIKNDLGILIEVVKAKTYQDGSNVSDNEVLGVIVSKFAKWDLQNIAEITESALEDSNFSMEDLTE